MSCQAGQSGAYRRHSRGLQLSWHRDTRGEPREHDSRWKLTRQHGAGRPTLERPDNTSSETPARKLRPSNYQRLGRSGESKASLATCR